MAIRLLATDLDGTLIGRANEFGLYEDFRELLDRIRGNGGVFWAVCTGRTLRSFERFFTPMSAVGISPDFVIVKHAYIYGIGRFGFAPHRLWNLRLRMEILSDRLRVRRAIRGWHAMVVRRFVRVRTIAKRSDRICLRFDSDDAAEAAAELLRREAETYRHVKVFRYSREVDVRSVPFTKGLSVSELARHLGVAREDVLAVGDGHNDLSMLDGDTAGMVGCPANAEAEVVERVHEANGHISDKRYLSGVLDVIKSHAAGTVRSELPDWWSNPAHGQNPRSTRRSGSGRRARRRLMRLALLLASGYAVLVAFASFGLVPLSGVIMRPYRALADVVERLLSVVYR
jgi:HAD superfamily hydrolase (TIGR01484 family)